MKYARRIRRLVCLAAALMTAAVSARAMAVPATEDRGLDLTEEVSVHYPALTGTDDPELEAAINDRIQQDLGIRELLARAAMLISGGRLQTSWTGGILGTDVFSCVLSAGGALRTPRPEHGLRGSSVDLRDGREIAFGELFTDETAARELLESYLEENVAPDLSAHLQSGEVLPLPDGFALDAAGLWLLYPAEQLSTLGDRAGEIRIGWHVLRDVLDNGEDGIPRRIGAEEMITLTPESGRKLLDTAAGGSLPGIPARLGDSVRELTDRYHLLTDPDGYEGGRLFMLEGGAFRNVWLLTDDLTRDWDNSLVEGIRMNEGCAYGLCTGETRREDWLAALGEPDSTVEITAEKAEANRIEPGTCDYYSCGNYWLRLYGSAEGALVSVVLTE